MNPLDIKLLKQSHRAALTLHFLCNLLKKSLHLLLSPGNVLYTFFFFADSITSVSPLSVAVKLLNALFEALDLQHIAAGLYRVALQC